MNSLFEYLERPASTVAEVAKQRAVSEKSIYGWAREFGDFNVDDIRRLKQVEAENARLSKISIDRDLEIPRVVSVQAHQQLVVSACSLGSTERHVCTLRKVFRFGVR
jgi:putative transposase